MKQEKDQTNTNPKLPLPLTSSTTSCDSKHHPNSTTTTSTDIPSTDQPLTSKPNNLALGLITTSFFGTIALISPFLTMQLRSPLPYMSTPRRKVLAALEEIATRKGYGNGSSSRIGSSTNVRNTTKLATSTNYPTDTSTDTNTNTNTNANNTTPMLNYYDLGSGDGETVLAAASTGKWNATGIELNSTLYFISSVRRLLLSFPPLSSIPIPVPMPVPSSETTTINGSNNSTSRKNSKKYSRFLWGDMWSQSLHDADAVMIFGVKPLMPSVAEKVGRECRPGSFLMSYRFRVPFVTLDDMDYDDDDDIDGEEKEEDVGVMGGKVLNAELIYDKDEMRIYELLGKKNKIPSHENNRN